MANTDKIHFYTYAYNFEENLVSRTNSVDSDFFNISSTKIYLSNICNFNKRLKILNEKLKGMHFSTDWVANAKLNKSLKNHLKILLHKIKCNDFEVNRNQMKQRNRLRKRIVEKMKSCKLYKICLRNKKEYFDAKISIWMKEHQNEILKEKENKKLKKDADIILTDIRMKRLSAKKSLCVLQELNLYRKLKVDVLRTSGSLIPTEANYVIHNIFTKLIHQWKTLSREYCLEEKGLKLMMETNNVGKTLKHTKNIFYDWETNLFKYKISVSCQLKENNHFLTLRMLWDKFLENNDGNEIPIGWIIPCPLSSYDWNKYMK